MSRFTRLLSGGVFTLLLTANVTAGADNLNDPALLESFMDGFIKPLMKAKNSPSATVAIAQNGQMVFAKGYGFRDTNKREPVDPYTTLFRPGSTSKLFTWVAVMQLVEQGQLDLDADVNNYLQSFKIKDTFDTPVTLRHIMTHTAGFEDGGMGYLIIEDPALSISLREAMERYQPKRVNPPGAQTAYSNYATALAGLIVSNVSGLPFADYIQQKILDPLDMKSSSFFEPLPEHLAETMAVGYALKDGGFVEKPFEIITNFAPAGSMSATSVDMIKFAQAILNGGELNGNRILKQETVDQMLTRNFSHDDRLMGMALGFYEGDHNGVRIVGHGGDTQWFHSDLGIDQEHGLVYFVSVSGTEGGEVRSLFAPTFYQQFFPRDEAPPVPPGDFSERAARYAGTYGFWRSNFSTFEKAFGMAGSIKVIPTQDNTLIVTMAGNAKQYAEIRDKLFRQINPGISLFGGLSPRLLAFQENEKGDITGFVMDGLPFMSLRKLPAHATPGFNFTLLGFSMLIFLLVLLRRFYQRVTLRSLPAADRSALNAAVYASAANLLAVISGLIVISMVMERLMSEIPLALKLWLTLPIIATLMGIYLLYRTIVVWKAGSLTGSWARIRFTVITLCALFMCWFYYFWNILGYQFF